MNKKQLSHEELIASGKKLVKLMESITQTINDSHADIIFAAEQTDKNTKKFLAGNKGLVQAQTLNLNSIRALEKNEFEIKNMKNLVEKIISQCIINSSYLENWFKHAGPGNKMLLPVKVAFKNTIPSIKAKLCAELNLDINIIDEVITTALNTELRRKHQDHAWKNPTGYNKEEYFRIKNLRELWLGYLSSEGKSPSAKLH